MEPIRGDQIINDPFYRYKMEKIKFEKEKTKTCIANLHNISQNLSVPSADIIVAFLKKKLAISITNNKGRIIITNYVDTEKIQNALYEFIEFFVLCPNKNCKKPELLYNKEKNNELGYKCKACGNSGIIENNNITSTTIKLFINAIK